MHSTNHFDSRQPDLLFYEYRERELPRRLAGNCDDLARSMKSLEYDFPTIFGRLTGKQNIADSRDVPEGYYPSGDADDENEPESIPIADTYIAGMPDYD